MHALPKARDASDPSPSSDGGWLERFHAGDREVLEACYVEHHEAVRRALGGIVSNRDRDSTLHQVFYRLLSDPELRASFQGGSFGGWLLTLARNEALQQRRRVARERPLEEAPSAATGPVLESELDLRRFVEEFKRDHLPPKWHGVFEARFLRGLTQREAATALGVSRTTLAYQEIQVRRLLGKAARSKSES
jgi:RNA polymerase sigma-70 factor (ECF subfamily)